MDRGPLVKINDCIFEAPVTYKRGMRVPARIYANDALIEQMDNAVLDQITNVAMLPGIQKYALCMPDGHSGYGFPIGGVAAIDVSDGVISPGGIGFDINCGVRIMTTSLTLDEVKPNIKKLVDMLFKRIPSGVGATGSVRLHGNQFDEAMVKGCGWALDKGFAVPDDIENCEENGCMPGADPSAVSSRARERGMNQLGTLGSGNHFLEIQIAKKENIFDAGRAREFGISGDNQIVIMIHSGSRAFGHQIATDYLQKFLSVMQTKYGLVMPDRELACVPFDSPEGQAYFKAMNCAINIAFLNRQLIMHGVREVLCECFKSDPERLGIRLVYDVCHNTAKIERHTVDGKTNELLVHRKGATRAFAAGMHGIPQRYARTGQPVIVGGSMESGSYLCAGVSGGADTFFSSVHGSGRVMSRHQAKSRFRGKDLQGALESRGIYIRTASYAGLAEEAGAAYKNIDQVIGAVSSAGISIPVAKLVPLGNIKG